MRRRQGCAHVAEVAGEAEGGDEALKAVIPRTRGLLQAIECTVEAAHMVRASGVNKASWLVTKDHLVKTPMKKGVLDVELANLPVGGEGDREDDPDGSWFNHRAKGLGEVNVTGFVKDIIYLLTSLLILNSY